MAPTLPDYLFVPPLTSLPDLHFRLARWEDYRALNAACYPHYPNGRFRDQFRRALNWQASGRCYHLVTEWLTPDRAGEIVGSGQLILYPHSAELAELATTAVYRSRGIGSAVITILTQIARYVGLTAVEISVTASNTRALALYRRLGFLVDRHSQLPGDHEMTIVLHKEL